MSNIEIVENSLRMSCESIIMNYLRIYNDYYKTYSRDSAFLKDLADILLHIQALFSDYDSEKGVYPDYALEKLNIIKNYVDSVIRYYEGKKDGI